MGFRDVAALGPIAPLLPSASNVGLETRPWAQELVHVTQGAISELYKTVSLITTELGDLIDGGSALPLHAATHLPNGTDPLATGIPVNVGLGPNAAGTANSFSRSDHVHALDQSANYHFTGSVTIDNLVAIATPSYGDVGLIQNVDLAPNLAGMSLLAARVDHHHTLDQDITPIWTSPHIWNTGIATEIPIKITMAAAQTAEPFRIEDSTGALVADILANGNIRFNTAGVVETSVPSNAKVLAVGPLVTGVTFPVGQFVAYDSQAYNTSDHGGGISFGGFYESTNSIFTTWAAIRGCKTDNVSNNYGGFLAFHVRTNGSPDIAERARFIETGQFGIGLTAPTSLLHLRTTASPQFRIDYDTFYGMSIAVSSTGTIQISTISPGGGAATRPIALRDTPNRNQKSDTFFLSVNDGAEQGILFANNLGEFTYGYGITGTNGPDGSILGFIENDSSHPTWAGYSRATGVFSYIFHAESILPTPTNAGFNSSIAGMRSWVDLRSGSAVPGTNLPVMGQSIGVACSYDAAFAGKTLASATFKMASTPGFRDYMDNAPDRQANNACPFGQWDSAGPVFIHFHAYRNLGDVAMDAAPPANKPLITWSIRVPIQGCGTDRQYGIFGEAPNFSRASQNVCTDSAFALVPFPTNTSATNRAHLDFTPTAAAAGGTPWTRSGGEYWDDGTNNPPGSYEFEGSVPHRRRTRQASATGSATVANTVTETTLVPSVSGNVTLSAKQLVAGRTVRLRVRGAYGTAAAAPTLRLKVKLIDSTPTTVTIWDTGAVTMTANLTNQYWEIDLELACRTTGATGTVFAQGLSTLANAATGALVIQGCAGGTANANTATSTIDTTKTEQVEITATWGTADPANTITCTNLTLEVL